MPHPFQSILGIRFYIGKLPGLLELCAEGHFVVVPAAPALADLPHDAAYREALEQSDFAITDSGFMVLVWRIITGRTLIRISGLKLLRGLLAGEDLRPPGRSAWIMPSREEMEVNVAWLARHGYGVTAQDCFIAPHYPKGPVSDPDLLRWLEARRPRYVLVNIGGGAQERLGLYLRRNLSYRPAIICVGAAIAFITGLQANISPWADAWGLGWFLRCLHAPRRFVPRAWKGLRLAPLLVRFRERSVRSGAN
jgi:UDP-N-acetyl-D-mannosaminuronic acid transferase (WecB/TagA/CpsF family)